MHGPMEMDPASAQDQRLAETLGALASPTRLALLRHVRTPKALREIEVKLPSPGGQALRNAARQTVREHLDKLLEVGVVHAREAERDYGPTVEYVLNHQVLFSMAEELRSLARLRPATEVPGATQQQASGPGTLDLRTPCLVLVKGLDEGRTFDLTPPANGRRAWIIGRSRSAQVSLDFDPFISSENACIVWEKGVHRLQDLPESRNGTALNFAPLAEGAMPSLRTGDLIGVGRCLLMFRASA